MNLVPWNSLGNYEGENPIPIKIGDQVFLDFDFDKNAPPPIFIVTANKDFPTGVDFELKMVNTVKKGVRSYKNYAWRFDCITEVVPSGPNEKEIAENLQKFGWSETGAGDIPDSAVLSYDDDFGTLTLEDSELESYTSSGTEFESITGEN